MTTFVLARMVEGNPLDYLHQKGLRWTESPAHAKWYHSREEAEADREHWSHRYPGIQVLPYDPIETLVNPTGAEVASGIQENLKNILRRGF